MLSKFSNMNPHDVSIGSGLLCMIVHVTVINENLPRYCMGMEITIEVFCFGDIWQPGQLIWKYAGLSLTQI